MLANRAGGKRGPGIAGVSLDYIGRPDFLKETAASATSSG